MDEKTKKALSGKASELTPEQLEKRKKINLKVFKFGCLPIILIVGILFAISASREDPPESPKTRAELIQEQFSEWDGSHFKTQFLLKKSMNDPDSYEHIQTVYYDMDSFLLVTTTFRGKNAFGAKVVNKKSAKVSVESGELMQWVE